VKNFNNNKGRAYTSPLTKVNKMTEFKISFILTRDIQTENPIDESWFDTDNIKSEIKTWLEDLDYGVHKIKVEEDK